jgi:hypothetical protein
MPHYYIAFCFVNITQYICHPTVERCLLYLQFGGDFFVRKNAAHKESSQEKSHVHRAKFNGRPKLPGWPGGRWRSPDSGRGVAFIEGGG